MKFIDLIKIIWQNMWKRRTRTIFTMSGVVIGCMAIFIISSISNGFEKYLTDEISSWMDTSTITITPAYGMEDEDGKDNKKLKTELNDKSIKELKEFPFVVDAFPIRTSFGMLKYKNKESGAQLTAEGKKNKDYDIKDNKDDNDKLLVGRYPKEKSKEITIGYDVAAILSGYEYGESDIDKDKVCKLLNKMVKISSEDSYVDERGNEFKPKETKIKIVGISKSDYENIISMKLMESLIKEKIGQTPESLKHELNNYNQIKVIVDSPEEIEEYESQIKELGYQTTSYKEFQNKIKSVLLGIKLVLGTLAGISLMVAALGITNTMDMAIYERKKEIGVIKVIGGSISDVKKIFVGEACAISFTGGVITVILGLVLDGIINAIAKVVVKPMINVEFGSVAIPSINLILGILAFSLFIGFIAGIMPASKAAKIDVISAIRE